MICEHCAGTGEVSDEAIYHISDDSIYLNAKLGAALKAEALAEVEANANPYWNRLAYLCLGDIAEDNRFVVSDDVRVMMWDRFPEITTHEPRAMGPVFLKGAAAEIIRKTGSTTNTEIPESHLSYRTVWESLICADFAV